MTKTHKTQTDRWTVQIKDADLRARLVAEADRQDRSVASLIRICIEACLPMDNPSGHLVGSSSGTFGDIPRTADGGYDFNKRIGRKAGR
jgi:hypothetical protein